MRVLQNCAEGTANQIVRKALHCDAQFEPSVFVALFICMCGVLSPVNRSRYLALLAGQ